MDGPSICQVSDDGNSTGNLRTDRVTTAAVESAAVGAFMFSALHASKSLSQRADGLAQEGERMETFNAKAEMSARDIYVLAILRCKDLIGTNDRQLIADTLNATATMLVSAAMMFEKDQTEVAEWFDDMPEPLRTEMLNTRSRVLELFTD